MARLTELPSIDIINAFSGILDFYLWRGLACVRRWPVYRPARRSAPAIASAALFGLIIKSYSLVAGDVLDALREAAADNPRTARDIHVSGVLGHLHEASMSDFLTLLQEARDFLEDLTALLGALHSIDTDEIVVNVDESALPAGAATAAHQVTQNTALAKIADLQNALQTVAADRFKVRGDDQLFSFNAPLDIYAGTNNADLGDNDMDSTVVPADTVWHITGLLAANLVSVCTLVEFRWYQGTTWRRFANTLTPVAGLFHIWNGHLFLKTGDQIRAHFEGCIAGDDLRFYGIGHIMTKET